MTTAILSQEIREIVDSAFTAIYEAGEDRDSRLDDLNSRITHLITVDNEADYMKYRFEAEEKFAKLAEKKEC